MASFIWCAPAVLGGCSPRILVLGRPFMITFAAGPDFAQWVGARRKNGCLKLQVIHRPEQQKGFAVLPKRWIVERTFGWFMKNRRLVRDYEVKTEHAECWLYVAMLSLMLRRIA